jgi:hypothetical protein
VLVAGSVLVGGCDGGGSKQDSLYQRLVNEGPWIIERFEGEFIAPNRHDQRYSELRVDFRQRNGGHGYQIIGRFSADSSRVLAEGIVRLRGDNVLRMRTGFDRPVTWNYGFEVSRAKLSLRFGYQEFLRTLFPGGTWRESEALEVTLAPDDE